MTTTDAELLELYRTRDTQQHAFIATLIEQIELYKVYLQKSDANFTAASKYNHALEARLALALKEVNEQRVLLAQAELHLKRARHFAESATIALASCDYQAARQLGGDVIKSFWAIRSS